MCGICGAVQLGGHEPRPPLAPGVLDRMTDAMAHRGPNDRGTYEAPGIALGARRLSIVDLAGGHQPFANEDGAVWAAQNGELYNHVELRRSLEGSGHRVRSRCDTEILPHLYEEHGAQFARELRGKFAIAVWDERRRRAVLARDRLGVKPLYVARVDDVLLFASELKSLLASGLVPLDLDYEAIDSYLTFGFVPGPRTLLAGVEKLLPGELLVAGADGVHRERYWSYPEPAPEHGRSPQEWAEGLLGELDEAVRLRLMADVPLGAMLSGGLDSSLIVALMARHHSGSVKTFSVGFREDGESNELGDARFVAETFGCDHHELELSFADQTIDLAELVWALDEPLAELSALGFLALSQLASQHVTVALSGQGADELLGGYKKHRAASLAGTLGRLPSPLLRAGAGVAPGPLRRAARTLAAPDAATRLVEMSGKVDPALRRELYRGPLDGQEGAARRAVSALLGDVDGSPLATTLFLDGQLALVDSMLHYFDRASMAHSLEVRVPFLDHHLVEFCARIPDDLKVRRLTTKYVLKEAARGVIPDRIIDKRKIGFFRGATDGWLRAQLTGAMSDYLLGPSPRYAEFLDRSAVEGLVAAHRSGRGGNTHLLVSILMLEVWLATFLGRRGGRVEPERESVRIPA